MWLLDTNALIILFKRSKSLYIKKDHSYTTIFNVIEYPPAINLDNLSIIYPKSIHYQNAFLLANALRDAGIGQSAMDILTVIIAIEKQMAIVTDDKDFQQIQTIEPRLNIISLDSYINLIKNLG